MAVDISTPSTSKFLKKMASIGVKTIIRYYDYSNETIKGKTLKLAERNSIASAGFSLMVVFQHNNNKFSSFTARRGRDDALRSLDLARANTQPPGSAIYFGVDGPWGSISSEREAIASYFTEAGKVLTSAKYKIGVYGSGLVCKQLRDAALVDLCWLANAKSWPRYKQLYDSKTWTLLQRLPEDCGGINVDFDLIGIYSDYGQFR